MTCVDGSWICLNTMNDVACTVGNGVLVVIGIASITVGGWLFYRFMCFVQNLWRVVSYFGEATRKYTLKEYDFKERSWNERFHWDFMKNDFVSLFKAKNINEYIKRENAKPENRRSDGDCVKRIV
jgi:hypothetical protein